MNLALPVRIEYSIFSILKKYITYHVTHPGKMGAFRVVGVPVVLYTLQRTVHYVVSGCFIWVTANARWSKDVWVLRSELVWHA